MLQEKNDNLDKLFLKYADLMNSVNSSHEDLNKLCIKKRITAGRDLRRELRNMRDIVNAMIKLSSSIEKGMRKDKEEKKNGL